jgi:hypothetical protein
MSIIESINVEIDVKDGVPKTIGWATLRCLTKVLGVKMKCII